ncbi:MULTISPECIES: hypothetical protein [Brucella]|uniref:Uncharacterized protein n=1 Tax=Brucella pituitosa TaxID=571256 RepID=A0A643EXB7_9HYPH|nr:MULTISPECIES: hypothetical protein [Brucella]KAB0570554.1 hypothetical protein F7Q93_15040 [Brucella pituitosa]
MDNEEKAGKVLPLSYDDLSNALTLSLARIDEQDATLMALTARVDTLEAFSSPSKQLLRQS